MRRLHSWAFKQIDGEIQELCTKSDLERNIFPDLQRLTIMISIEQLFQTLERQHQHHSKLFLRHSINIGSFLQQAKDLDQYIFGPFSYLLRRYHGYQSNRAHHLIELFARHHHHIQVRDFIGLRPGI